VFSRWQHHSQWSLRALVTSTCSVIINMEIIPRTLLCATAGVIMLYYGTLHILFRTESIKHLLIVGSFLSKIENSALITNSQANSFQHLTSSVCIITVASFCDVILSSETARQNLPAEARQC